ncbi:Uma2 family endonuclease [Actinocrispum wychmicini]|nr:Uma2 family endonuclease [Actinocrispum wychmicini]
MEQLPTDTEVHLYTVGEYAALGETEYRTELQEGIIVMSPSPKLRHMKGLLALARQIEDQLPEGLGVVAEIDVDLEFDEPDEPGTVRQPDLIVGDEAAFERAEDQGKLIRAADVLLAVEFVSPGSRRMDNRVKRAEYADAGIPNYWIIDVNKGLSLLACELTRDSGYVDSGPIIGSTFTTTKPFPMTVDLTKLVRRQAAE